jgi:hypothetical protein
MRFSDDRSERMRPPHFVDPPNTDLFLLHR